MHNTREKSSIVHGESGLRVHRICAPHVCALEPTVSQRDCTYVYVYSAAKLAPRSASRRVLPGTLETTTPSFACLLRTLLSMICSSRISRERVVISSARRRSRWSRTASGILRTDIWNAYIYLWAISRRVEDIWWIVFSNIDIVTIIIK